MASYVYSSANTGFSFFLDNLVTSAPNEGLLKITLQTSPGGLDYAEPTLPLASTTTEAGDYVGGSVGLASLSGLLEVMSDRDMLVGDTGEFGNIAILPGSSTALSYLRVNAAGTANEWAELQVDAYDLKFDVTAGGPIVVTGPGGSIGIDVFERPLYVNQTATYNIVTSSVTNYADQASILVGDSTGCSPISPTITGSVPTYNGTNTVWQYPSVYTTNVVVGSGYLPVAGGDPPVGIMNTGPLTGLLYDILVSGSVSLPPEATLVFRPILHMTTSTTSGAGGLSYWVGSDVAIGTPYNSNQFFKVNGTQDVMFRPSIPVLVSSLANPSLVALIFYMQNTYAAPSVVQGNCVDVIIQVDIHPYGLAD